MIFDFDIQRIRHTSAAVPFTPITPAPDALLKQLSPGAYELAVELQPVFALFGIVQPDFRNFCKTMIVFLEVQSSEHGKKQLFEHVMAYIFHHYDKDGDGYISRDEIKNVMRDTLQIIDPDMAQNDELVNEGAELIFKQADANNDGKINKAEFIANFSLMKQ